MTPTLRSSSVVAGLVLIVFTGLTWASSPANPSLKLGATGLVFEPNVGQVDVDADYIARSGSTMLALRATDFSLSTTSTSSDAPSSLRVRLLGARADTQAEASEHLRGTVSDYRGANPKDWHLKIPTYSRVRYSNVYDGIDIAYHSAKRGFEYDLIVAPGADPNTVRLAFEGADDLALDPSGALIATMHGGTLVQRIPIAYQEASGKRKRIEVAYRVDSGNIVHFELGAYDVSQPLIIDPLAYSTLFFYQNNATVHHIAVDSAGNAYVAAEGTTSATTPTIDAVVQKVAPDGTLVWTQIFHGNGNKDHDDVASGIALDASGANIFVVGSTTSDDFPTTPSAFSAQCGNGGGSVPPTNIGACKGKSDAFVIKLNAADGSLLYSSYFGGPYTDTGNAIAVDSAGFVYITGSASPPQFPTQGPSHATHSGNSQCTLDAYLAKFDLTKTGPASLVFSTLLGGDGDDRGNALAIAPGQIRVRAPCTRFPCPLFSLTGSIYIAGTTGDTCKANLDNSGQPAPNNTPFPTTANAFTTDDGSSPHAFVVLLDTTGTRLLYSTISLGTSALGVAVAPRSATGGPNLFTQGFSDALITGVTPDSGTSPTAGFQTRFGGGASDAYVAKFDPIQQGSNSLVYFTYLGGLGNDEGHDIATDASGSATIVGSTNSSNFPIPRTLPRLAPVQSALAPSCTSTNCLDAFVATLSSNGRGEGYATYLGGSADDTATGVALCNSAACSGSIFIAGTTFSTNFPVTLGTFVGGPDGFVAKISFSPLVIKAPNRTPVH